MKRLVTLVTVLLVGLASVQAVQSDDQQKKKKKKAQTTQTATPAPKTGGTQTSKRKTGTQTRTQTSNQRVSSQTSKKHVSSQTSGNQQVTNRQSKKHAEAAANYNQQNVQRAKKSKQANAVVNNNVQANKKAVKQFKRTGNEVSFNVARSRIVRERHDRNWWNRHYSRIIFYGGGYWYWNAGWWYPAWGYSPYYNNYFYNGPIFGYGYASPFDVTAQVQRALAARGYYYGPIDGILGSGTRNAIQRYQIDQGLYATAAIDEPTLYRLGLA
jgi:Putative peptidoglycan binding domain